MTLTADAGTCISGEKKKKSHSFSTGLAPVEEGTIQCGRENSGTFFPPPPKNSPCSVFPLQASFVLRAAAPLSSSQLLEGLRYIFSWLVLLL